MAATYRTSAAGGGTTGSANRNAAITPAVGDLFLVFCNASGNTSSTPTCSDNNGGTYTRVGTAAKNSSADTLSVFVRDQLLANTTVTTVTVATGSNTAAEIVVVAFAGMQRAGSSAIRGSGFQANQSSGGTPAPALSAAALTTNPTVLAVANGTAAGSVWTPPTNWTERQDVGQSSPTTGLEVATRDSGFTGTSSTTGAGTSASAFASVIVELDGSPPTYTASAAVTHGPRTASGTATFTAPVYSATAGVSHGAVTASGSAVFVGVATGSAAVTRGPLTASASGSTSGPHPVGVLTQLRGGLYGRRYGDFSGKPNTPPYAEGTAAVTTAAVTASGSASVSGPHPVGVLTQFRGGLYGRRYSTFAGKGGSAGVAGLSLGPLAAVGTATFVAPVYTASAAVSRGGTTAAGTALFVSPVYSAGGTVSLGGVTAAGVATFAVPVYTGSAAVALAAKTASSSAAFAAEVYLGGAGVSLGGKVAAGTATFVSPVYTATATVTRGPLVLVGTAAFAVPVYTASATVSHGGVTGTGSAQFESTSPPVDPGVVDGRVSVLYWSPRSVLLQWQSRTVVLTWSEPQ